MPATDTIDFEREFEELVAELRALPSAAPDHVREHMRTLGEPDVGPHLWDRLVTFPWRRSLLVLAPVCALGLVSAALVHGLVNSGPKREAVATGQQGKAAKTAHAQAFGALDSALPAPTPGRYQDYEAWMTLRVNDLQALTDRTNEAMQVVRAAGGYVASVQQSTAAGNPGQADLVLRVPIARVENVLVQLSNLGTVIDRHLSIRDLEQVVRQQRAHILELKLFIARAVEQLRRTLPADVRLRLQLQLEQARSDLSGLTGANRATLRQASLSRVSLTLTTQKAVGTAKKSGSGRVDRAARDAASFLVAAGAVLLFLLIVLSPLLVLTAAVIWGVRAYRRREERRLLAST